LAGAAIMLYFVALKQHISQRKALSAGKRDAAKRGKSPHYCTDVEHRIGFKLKKQLSRGTS